MEKLTYAQSGVDVQKADRFVGSIRKLTQKAKVRDANVIKSPSGYASLYKMNDQQLLAASTDGVGSKLKLAFEAGIHDTVGIDLVAMNVNDLLCVGAQPLFFLDYFATGHLETDVAERVLHGIVEGCDLAGCTLMGGETAEMPGFYPRGEYDLAGFAVGLVKPSRVLPKKVQPGDTLIGVGSSGFHSNGYSLIRKLLSGSPQSTTLSMLLEPTRIYVQSLLPLLDEGCVQAAAHITGSGLTNILRMSKEVSYEVELPTIEESPKAFRWLRTEHEKQVELEELCQTFNMGYGLVLVVQAEKVDGVVKKLRERGEVARTIGQVVPRRDRAQVIVHNPQSGRSFSMD